MMTLINKYFYLNLWRFDKDPVHDFVNTSCASLI